MPAGALSEQHRLQFLTVSKPHRLRGTTHTNIAVSLEVVAAPSAGNAFQLRFKPTDRIADKRSGFQRVGDKRAVSGALCCAAAVAVLFGWYQMLHFSTTPGEQESGPATWPHAEPRPGAGQAPLLLVFIHPGCSCTHATLQELDRLLAENHGPIDVVLEVYRSKAMVNSGYSSVLDVTPWFDRRAILAADVDGRMARLFRARTSGEVLLYSEGGVLLFQGGMTAERAQLGRSVGAVRLHQALLSGLPARDQSPVFGCPIFHLPRSG